MRKREVINRDIKFLEFLDRKGTALDLYAVDVIFITNGSIDAYGILRPNWFRIQTRCVKEK